MGSAAQIPAANPGAWLLAGAAILFLVLSVCLNRRSGFRRAEHPDTTIPDLLLTLIRLRLDLAEESAVRTEGAPPANPPPVPPEPIGAQLARLDRSLGPPGVPASLTESELAISHAARPQPHLASGADRRRPPAGGFS